MQFVPGVAQASGGEGQGGQFAESPTGHGTPPGQESHSQGSFLHPMLQRALRENHSTAAKAHHSAIEAAHLTSGPASLPDKALGKRPLGSLANGSSQQLHYSH